MAYLTSEVSPRTKGFHESDSNEYDMHLLRYRPKSLAELARMSGFTTEQVKVLYRGFKQECPNGIMAEVTLRDVLVHLFPFGDVFLYCKQIWRMLRRDVTSPFISFEDFLACLSILLNGTASQRAEWIFRLYDTDEDGTISIQDLARTVEGVFLLMGTNCVPPVQSEMVDAVIKRITKKMNFTEDGTVSKEIFVSTLLSDKEAADTLGGFRDLILLPKIS